MMKTKQEILDSHRNVTDHYADQEWTDNAVLSAMEEYLNEFIKYHNL